MNKIDEIKEKLCWAIGIIIEQGISIEKGHTADVYNSYEEFKAHVDESVRDRIDWLYALISPYLSHGITEEEARSIRGLMSEEPDSDELIYAAKTLGLITSSREPVAGSEQIEQRPSIEVEENTDYYEAKLLVRNRIGDDSFDIDDLEDFIDEADTRISELEARVKELEGK